MASQPPPVHNKPTPSRATACAAPCPRMASFVERMRALRIGDRYTLFSLLGEGSFGKVYLGGLSGQLDIASTYG